MIRPFQIRVIMTFLQALALTGCTTSFLPNVIIKPTIAVSNTPFAVPSSTSAQIVISQVNVNLSSTGTTTPTTSPSASPSPGAGPSYLTTIFFDVLRSQDAINSHCLVGANGTTLSQKQCYCQFSWGDLTPKNSNTTSIPRKVQTPVASIQTNLITCKAPAVWSSEIIDGTKLSITVVPAQNNPDAGLFTVSRYSFTKTSKATSGSFQDLTGNIYDNIHHYACYQKFKRGMQIVSKKISMTNTKNSQSYRAYYASRFCLALANSGPSSNSDCSATTSPDYSAQSYYFNFYIRNSERGDINLFNSNYVCPRVMETLDPDPIGGRTGTVWPLDATFALSIGPTSTFVVGVEANTKLGSSQDPWSVANTCFPSANGGGAAATQGTSDSIVRSCLGFAAKPNSDGTCPYIQDANQQIVPTFRLRRYYAIYPRVYDTDGKPIQGLDQSIDSIYVLDRPVKSPTNADHTKPYTMLGPKPCPFAFFDRKGVTLSDSVATPSPYPEYSPYPIQPAGYVSTSSTTWSGVNIDGIEFPNIDGKDEDSVNQCSAILPFLTTSSSNLRQYVLRTINRYNIPKEIRHAYIRPIEPFIPHYEEDQNFLACAPQAKPLNDPPLHFTRDPISGNVAWCAESYPTQNPNVTEFDPAATGVIPFTSHIVHNSSSQACSATILSSYPTQYSSLVGKHSAVTWSHDHGLASQTCDRTVVQTILPGTNGSNVSASSEWPRFPILAHADEIENSIYKDKSYFCTITYDANGEKKGIYTPSSGCCASTSVQVPSFSFASGSTTTPPAPNTAPLSGHLESDIGCSTPTY